ncbi:MAG: hypothetical protein JXA82_05555 [Sedimentisphaerales bacterium]|nr:hypothetical protein [Sedimentisphaerales bacterium]
MAHGDNKYLEKLGLLMSLFHSLEFLLRVYLYYLPEAIAGRNEKRKAIPGKTHIYYSKVGEDVNLTEMTNYDTIGKLIEKYNRNQSTPKEAKIEKARLVALRDALAHGRVSSLSAEGDAHLIKFSKPIKDKTTVKITFNETLSESWFDEQIQKVQTAINKVYATPILQERYEVIK